jgi:excisionase family DNA binding protein
MRYVSTREACKQLGVHPNTLRNWDRDKTITTIRTPGGQRLYDLNSIIPTGKRNFIYARVSSRNQKDDLKSQVEYLRARYPNHELVEDIGSGLNFKRKGFRTLLELIMQGDVGELVIAHRDRLCRFGFELVVAVATKNKCRIVVLENSSLSPQEELVRDLLSIVHVFSCRLYGLRKYSGKIKKDQDLPQGPKQSEAVLRTESVLVQQSS